MFSFKLRNIKFINQVFKGQNGVEGIYKAGFEELKGVEKMEVKGFSP